ncbi:hypothetical protein PTKIN_Ptkin17bG0075200 [Pterospermum kingtungense]
MSAFNDAFTPGKFDNFYYRNLLIGLRLLSSDPALLMDNRSRPFCGPVCCKSDSIFSYVCPFHGEVERL